MKNTIKIYAGYINLKPINGVIFPSYAQNQVNKEFINNKLNGQFFMTTNENMYGENSIILRSLIKEKSINGIVMLSTFCLPENIGERIKIYKMLKTFKKSIHFIFEELNYNSQSIKIDEIEMYLMFDNNFFTQKKISLSRQEKQFIDKTWQFI